MTNGGARASEEVMNRRELIAGAIASAAAAQLPAVVEAAPVIFPEMSGGWGEVVCVALFSVADDVAFAVRIKEKHR